MPVTPEMSESNREALIIRWRRLLVLGLIDYFNVSNEFGKLIIKEIIDMREAIIKAYASRLRISIQNQNGGWRKLNNIMKDINDDPNVPNDVKTKLNDSENMIISEQISPNRTLKDLRNEETHSLNLNDIPSETVTRIWRMFFELVEAIDPDFFNYARNRPDIKDFYNLQDFFRKVVIDGNRVGINLDEIKEKEEEYYRKDPYKRRYIPIKVEKGIYEIIESIKKGGW